MDPSPFAVSSSRGDGVAMRESGEEGTAAAAASRWWCTRRELHDRYVSEANRELHDIVNALLAAHA